MIIRSVHLVRMEELTVDAAFDPNIAIRVPSPEPG
jgi:hypothetical protein